MLLKVVELKLLNATNLLFSIRSLNKQHQPLRYTKKVNHDRMHHRKLQQIPNYHEKNLHLASENKRIKFYRTSF
jgi:hypothetical protein